MRKIVAYQKVDAEAFDYEIYFIDDFRFGLRGPRVPWHLYDDYHAAIGSAGVFGRFCQQPYVQQLNIMGFPTVNLGMSGARPEHYLQPTALQDVLGGCRILLLEIMAARGYATRFYTPTTVWTNAGTYIAPNGEETARTFVDRAWDRAVTDYGRDVVDAEIEASRARYLADMTEILRRYGRQVVLLWISQRTPTYDETGTEFKDFSGWFPHLVDQPTRDALVQAAIDIKGAGNVTLIEVIGREGLPQPIFNRHSGEPAHFMPPRTKPSVNDYYSSPAIHDIAARKLLDAFRAFTPG